jgi:hypothetical protein
MRIITKRKIITRNSENNFSNIDGTSSSNQVLHFQKWMNKAHPELGGKIAEDGVFKVNDGLFYKTYGAEYERAAAALSNLFSQNFGVGTMVNPIGAKETDKNYIKGGLMAQKDWAKNYKPLSTPAEKKQEQRQIVEEIEKSKLTNLQKGLIIGGGAAVLITIIALIAKK